jgi:DNA-directed RNA polymerase specialized sigma24 family protein
VLVEATVVEAVFEQSYSAASRLVAVRAAAIVTLYRLPADSRRDLEQEALLELWRKRWAFDPRRASWRTFSERVVANRMSSLVRAMHSRRSGQFREESLDAVVGLMAPDRQMDLSTDVSRVLSDVSPFDRKVAIDLIDYCAVETSRRLGVSRATVYRAIDRLRDAFAKAGLSPRGRKHDSKA